MRYDRAPAEREQQGHKSRLFGLRRPPRGLPPTLEASSVPWVALDFETTGIHPGYHHRVVEIGLVVGRGSTIEESWTTLVCPDRDIGAGEIHGLYGRDLADAPRFEDVAGSVLDRIRGRWVIAHNARFDEAFLIAELRRAGIELARLPWLCTLELTRGLGAQSGRLTDCCRALNVEHVGAHTAAGDAHACALLFIACLPHLSLETPPAAPGWPELPGSAAPVPRGAPRRPRDSYLAQLVSRRPPLARAADSETAAYLEVLDRVLEDRQVSRTEAAELAEVAEMLNLSAAQVDAAHHGYLAALRNQALADGVVTDRERRDLDCVSELLGVPVEVMDSAEAVLRRASEGSGAVSRAAEASMAGRSVCFTGALTCTYDGAPITREVAHDLATRAGLAVQPRVTQKLDLLVVADPETLSGKAKKARECGTRIVAESVFWPMIGVDVS